MSFKRTAVGQHLSLSAPNEYVHDEKEKSTYEFQILKTFQIPYFWGHGTLMMVSVCVRMRGNFTAGPGFFSDSSLGQTYHCI